MYWWGNGIQTHDLCEEPTDLTITGTDACSGSNVNIEYLLFLDLDGDGTMETVVNSVNTGIAGLGWNNVLFNNLNTPNFSGGTPRAFDERPVPTNQKYGFSIQETVIGTNKTASVRLRDWQPLEHPVSDRQNAAGGLCSLSVFAAGSAAMKALRYFLGDGDFEGGRGELLFDDYQLDAFKVDRRPDCRICSVL